MIIEYIKRVKRSRIKKNKMHNRYLIKHVYGHRNLYKGIYSWFWIRLRNVHRGRWRDFWRRHPESNQGIKDLQSSALPLGYAAGILCQLSFHILRYISSIIVSRNLVREFTDLGLIKQNLTSLSPLRCSRLSFERTNDLACNPPTVKFPWLGFHALTCDITR